ncbi:unnamed protein product [Closterium sp. Yama58-4]|nr:unnamed protein product [Closterium sp. Yama58-4]
MWCAVWHRGGTGVAQGWHRGGTGVAQGWYRGGTGVAQGWHRGGTGVAQGWHRGGTGVAQHRVRQSRGAGLTGSVKALRARDDLRVLLRCTCLALRRPRTVTTGGGKMVT